MTQSYYAIALNNCSGTKYTQNAIKLVNRMLALGIDAWWLQKRVRGAKRVYTRGDFVIAFNSFGAVRYLLATISATSPKIQLANPELTRVRGLRPSKKAIANSTGKPAIIAAEYGHGKVVLSAPHPESPGSKHSYRLLANEVFYVSSVYKSHNPNDPGASDTSTRNLLTESIIVCLEKLLRTIYNVVEMMHGSEDIDIEVYGAIAEFMLLYLNDSAQRLEKVINFYTIVFASRSIDDTVKTKAINKINSLATSEALEVVKETITFLGDHYKSLNVTLALREALNGTITDEYSNLVNMAYASFTDALDVYKYGVAAKILDASFAVTKVEEAVKFVGISIKH